MEYVSIRKPRGNSEFRVSEGKPRKDEDTGKDIVQEFPLEYVLSSDNIVPCGILTVTASREGLYQRLWHRIFVVFVTNAVQIFLAALCILIIIQLLITRWLTVMAKYAEGLNLVPKRKKENEFIMYATMVPDLIWNMLINFF